MLKLIANKFREFRARSKERLYQAGYDYAAGKLLQGHSSAIYPLEIQLDNAGDFGTYNSFDDGVAQALRDYRTLVGAVSGRG